MADSLRAYLDPASSHSQHHATNCTERAHEPPLRGLHQRRPGGAKRTTRYVSFGEYRTDP